MYTIRLSTIPAHIYGFTILLGLRMTTSQAEYAMRPLLMRSDRVAEVIQFLNIPQNQSQLIDLVIANSLFQSKIYSGLKALLAETEYPVSDIHAVIANARSTMLHTTSSNLRIKCIEVIVRSINDAWVLIITADAFYILCLCFLNRKRYVDVSDETSSS